MNSEKANIEWEVWGAAVIVVVATLAGFHYRGFQGETVLEATRDIGTAVIPILTAFVTARLVMRNMSLEDRCQKAGEEALRRVQEKHPDLLSGPKANREKYDQENVDSQKRYFFFQRKNKGDKAQLIPLLPLKEGIVEIRVPKTTMLLLGCKREGLESLQRDLLAKVREAVRTMLDRDCAGSFEILEHKHEDIAIVVDFDESNLSLKSYGKAIEACAETAFTTIVKTAKEMARQVGTTG
jgi:hypothetical protein